MYKFKITNCFYLPSSCETEEFGKIWVWAFFDGFSAFDGSTNVLCLSNNLLHSFSNLFSLSAHSIYTYLNSHLDVIKKSLPVGFLTVDLHVWPDFHGNRSPLTDLTLKGMVRNSLSLQKGQYRVKKKKKKAWKGLFSNFERTPPYLFKLSHRIWISCSISKCADVSVENQRSL